MSDFKNCFGVNGMILAERNANVNKATNGSREKAKWSKAYSARHHCTCAEVNTLSWPSD